MLSKFMIHSVTFFKNIFYVWFLHVRPFILKMSGHVLRFYEKGYLLCVSIRDVTLQCAVWHHRVIWSNKKETLCIFSQYEIIRGNDERNQSTSLFCSNMKEKWQRMWILLRLCNVIAIGQLIANGGAIALKTAKEGIVLNDALNALFSS